MLLKFYGTRGSVPVSGPETKKHGGNTTCLYVEAQSGDNIIIDAGTGIRELGRVLVTQGKKRINLIFSHYHWDHIQGFPYFAPVFQKEIELHIYGPADEVAAEKALSYQMTMPYFPVDLSALPAKIVFHNLKKTLDVGSIKIETIVNNHPNHTRGFKFTEGKKSFAFLTDNEMRAQNGKTLYKEFVDFVRKTDLVIHDAQYTDEVYRMRIGWGHSTYHQVAELVQEAGVRKTMVTHHDHFSSDNFIEKNIKDVRQKFPKLEIEAAADGKSQRV
ncbi:MAG: MBL fold metallo-hydrolase [candidate division WOR-3 bacterium]|jgi:phosphoribosyl 1,2-cyclic phosphodiesterase